MKKEGWHALAAARRKGSEKEGLTATRRLVAARSCWRRERVTSKPEAGKPGETRGCKQKGWLQRRKKAASKKAGDSKKPVDDWRQEGAGGHRPAAARKPATTRRARREGFRREGCQVETGHCQRRGRRPKASGNQKPKPGGDEAGMLTAKRQGCWPGGEALVMLLAPIRESLPASEPSVLPHPLASGSCPKFLERT